MRIPVGGFAKFACRSLALGSSTSELLPPCNCVRLGVYGDRGFGFASFGLLMVQVFRGFDVRWAWV